MNILIDVCHEMNMSYHPKRNGQIGTNPNQKILSKEEINKLMANFLSERNDLVQNMEEKNKQVSLENNKQTNLSN